MPRKIIQISTDANSIHRSLTALCNDNSVWFLKTISQGYDQWNRLPDIPQDGYVEEDFKQEDFIKKIYLDYYCNKR